LADAAVANAHAAVSVGFESNQIWVSETNQQVTLNVLRSGDASVAFTVDYQTIGREATPGADFVPQSGTLQFAAGETNHVITVPILDDGLVEPDEAFRVELQNPSDGVTTNATSTAWVTIQDNEKPLTFDPTFSQNVIADGAIEALAPQPDGKLVLYGTFNHVGGVERIRLARLNKDGSLDSSFVANSLPPLQCSQPGHLLLQSDGKVLLGMNTSCAFYTNLDSLVRFNVNGSRDTNFTAPAGLKGVNALAQQTDGKTVIWAESWDTNLLARPGIARINSDGTLDESFHPDLGGGATVTVMAMQSQDRLVVGVYYRDRGAVLLRFNPDGRRDPSFVPEIASETDLLYFQIFAILTQKDDGLIISRGFSGPDLRFPADTLRRNPDGALDANFADTRRLNADGSLDAVFKIPAVLSNYPWYPLYPAGDKFLIVSSVSHSDGTLPINIVRLKSDGSLDASFMPLQGTSQFLKGLSFAITAMPDESIAVVQNPYYAPNWPATLVRFAADSVNVPAFAFTVTNLIFNEDATNKFITIHRQGFTGGTNSVDYEISGGAAVPGMDYVPQKGTLVFAPFEVTKQLLLPLLDDHVTAGLKTFQVRLTGASQGVLLDTNTIVTITVTDEDFSGSVDPTFDFHVHDLPRVGIATPVEAHESFVQNDGKPIVDIEYFVTGTQPPWYGVVRLNLDGSYDESFWCSCGYSNPGGLAFHAVQPDGKILLLSNYHPFTWQKLFRLNPDGSGDATFVPPSFDWRYFTQFSAFTLNDGRLILITTYAGSGPGYPDGTGSHLRGTIVRLNPDGSLDPSLSLTTRTNGGFYWVLQQPDGKLLVNGERFDFGGKEISGLIRLNTDASLDSTFHGLLKPEFTLPIQKAALQPDGKVVLAVYHAGDTNGNPTYTSVQRLNANGTADTNFPIVKITGPEIGYGTVSALVIQPDRRILVGGTFTHVGELERNGIARLNEDGSVDPIFDPDEGQGPCPTCNRPIATLDLLPDGKLMASGKFTEFAGIPRPGIVRLNNHIQLKFIGSERASDGSLKLRLSSPPALTAVLEASADLKTWSAVSTNTSVGLYLNFIYAAPTDSGAGFLRVRQLQP
ncbi:MAG: hypothetical protein HY043_02850, partial [Verrucomicrobia bacterium]|nr:hypothetical protein [Verrucomicrobiota bacterium]